MAAAALKTATLFPKSKPSGFRTPIETGTHNEALWQLQRRPLHNKIAVERGTTQNIKLRSFRVSDDHIQSGKEKRSGNVQGHSCPTFAINAAFHSPPTRSKHLPPLHFLLLDPFLKWLVIFWSTFLSCAILRGWIFFLLLHALWFGAFSSLFFIFFLFFLFLQVGSRGTFDTRIFLVIKRSGTDTTFWAATASRALETLQLSLDSPCLLHP